MKTTLGCMRAYLSRVIFAGLLGGIALGGATLLGAGLVFAGDTTSPLTSETSATEDPVPSAAYDESQPGADDPRVKEGFAAYKSGDFKQAYDIWLPLAEAGNAEAQFRVGRLYHVTEIIVTDRKNVIYWYDLASSQGHISASYNLGKIFRRGKIVNYDFEKAIKYYSIAAEAMHRNAQLSLGIAYATAPEPKRNFSKAYMWLYISLKNGGEEAADIISKLNKFGTIEQRSRGIEDMREWFDNHSRRPKG